MRHGDDARQHHFAIGVDVGAAMAGQEALVDLDGIDRQVAELAEGGLAPVPKSSIDSPAPAARMRAMICGILASGGDGAFR